MRFFCSSRLVGRGLVLPTHFHHQSSGFSRIYIECGLGHWCAPRLHGAAPSSRGDLREQASHQPRLRNDGLQPRENLRLPGPGGDRRLRKPEVVGSWHLRQRTHPHPRGRHEAGGTPRMPRRPSSAANVPRHLTPPDSSAERPHDRRSRLNSDMCVSEVVTRTTLPPRSPNGVGPEAPATKLSDWHT